MKPDYEKAIKPQYEKRQGGKERKSDEKKDKRNRAPELPSK